jgi:hypothetical protein
VPLKNRRQVLCYAMLLLPVLTAIGCGDNGLATVSGEVTLASQPLATGQVVFNPVGKQPTAIGHIQSDGTYYLSTGRETGVAPGEYIVTVQAREPTIEPTDNTSGPRTGKLLTPEEYGSARTSPLRFTAEPGSNTFDIALP